MLGYQRYVSDDRQVVHVYERYENSAAAIAHLQKFAPTFGTSASATRAWWAGNASWCLGIRAASYGLCWTDTGPPTTSPLGFAYWG